MRLPQNTSVGIFEPVPLPAKPSGVMVATEFRPRPDLVQETEARRVRGQGMERTFQMAQTNLRP